ncbi:PglZ domain-containing protein [Dehalococcoides mccartyi]|uniref:Uncharacterized protein n=1 Tax=Dehalococcoides mccartyi (strain VS) TaxID=311424 RepID=D2BGH1_DEHMV|nr:PglZ domain-containing protein [Dehalococcoides mccartyi]ACZ61421.1 hypothetical protein DhcVS_259 [Dehalococcoides mccartyi VS]
MKFTSFLHKKLADLLNDRRIVVWYDAQGDFKEFAASFGAPNCEVLSADASVLKIRRRADEVYRLMNESEDSSERERYMLIYIPRGRGVTEDEKMRDPFEVYAIAGVAFGDTEDQKIESLARQAMPNKAEEISRLFREGNPDIALLDELENTQKWPVLNEVFHTETPSDIAALALCNTVKAEEVDSRPGCIAELLRLFEDVFGFKTSERRKWKTLRPKAAEYILISEFLFDLPDRFPEALSAVPRASNDAKSTVYAACDRMRADLGLQETYIELAGAIEDSLHLSTILPGDLKLGGRDTFPFEERRLLSRAVTHVVFGDATAARIVNERQKHSIWRHDPQRSLAWTVIERATVLIELCTLVSHGLSSKKELVGLIKAYTECGWSNLDRASRLFEAALTACPDEDIIEPIIDPCRRRYREAVVQLQDNLLMAVQAEGWPPDGAPRQTRIFDDLVAPLLERRKKTAFFMVDSLRYEMGRDLADALAGTGSVEINYAAGTIPTVTGCGMAALMPGADGMLRLVAKDGGLVPAVGNRFLKTSADRMRFLSEIYGDRFFETTLDEMLGSPKKIAANIKNAELFVVRTQDPDAVAENLGGWRARRYLSDVVGDIASAVRWLASQGYNHIVISADHGHMMLPEIPPGDVVQTPPGGWLENKRRCRLGSGLAGAAGTITLKASNLGIQGDVHDVCLPVGFRVFSEGEGYFHGGLSLQEAVVPVVVFQAGAEKQSTAGKPDIDILYRSDKFTSRVIGLKFRLQGDMFGTANRVRIESFDGPGIKAKIIGEAADCEARDEKTHEVSLQAGKETPVPILIDPDFDGPEVEIRVSDPETRVVWAKLKLKNAMLD